jgi:ABC-2 type transport system ATP-binding protein
MHQLAIRTEHLTKFYDQSQDWRRRDPDARVLAVDDVSLSVEQGELFGLLGPNGAGKTTLVKMLTTLILPNSGELEINGYTLDDADAIRASVGLVVSDERSFYWRLSARRNLHFFAATYGLFGRKATQRVDEVLADVELLDRAEHRFSNFSSGMRQRLAIARALLHRPKLLFLDEPTRSLDPIHTQQLHDLILEMIANQGLTVFLITHDLVEAEKLCDRVAVMDKGRIQAVGAAAELRRQLQPRQKYTLTVSAISAEIRHAITALCPDARIEQQQLTFYAPEQGDQLSQVIDILRGGAVTITNVNSRPPTLDEVFAHLTTESSG